MCRLGTPKPSRELRGGVVMPVSVQRKNLSWKRHDSGERLGPLREIVLPVSRQQIRTVPAGSQSACEATSTIYPLQPMLVCEIKETVSGGAWGPGCRTPRSFRSSASWSACCQNRPGFDTYALARRSVTPKGVFRFDHFGEKLIGLSGGSSFAPPQATHVTDKKPDHAHDTDGQCDAHGWAV